MPSHLPHLVITDADGNETTHLLDQGLTWKIGRGESNTIVVHDDGASKRHAMIQRTEMGEFYLMDVGSRNGTFLKGKRVSTPIVLRTGDEISIGGHRMVFSNPMAVAAAEGVPTAAEEFTTGTRVIFNERMVTILVVDLKDFTQLTQEIDQEALSTFVSRWFSEASEIFRKHGAWGLKYIGDAVMSAWIHEPGGNENCVRSALEAVCEFAEVSCRSEYSLPHPVSFGAGLNTGFAAVGNAGSAETTDYTAFGDAVNAAFRIEAGTRKMGCDFAMGAKSVELLGFSVADYLRDHTLQLKGYQAPVEVWAGTFADLRNLLSARS